MKVYTEEKILEPYLNTSLTPIEGEIWKDIPDYEGIYQISSFGRVKSLSRIACNGRKIKERILKSWYSGNQQLQVTLAVNKHKYKRNVSQLVGSTFIGVTKKNEVYTHLDSNKYNNNISNICIKTKSDQVKISYKNGILKDWGIKEVGIETRFKKNNL